MLSPLHNSLWTLWCESSFGLIAVDIAEYLCFRSICIESLGRASALSLVVLAPSLNEVFTSL
jgi:hypothetical protein